MKKTLRTLVFLLIMLIGVCFANIAASAAEEPVRYGGTTLSGNAKYVYETLVAEVNKEVPTAEIRFSASKNITKAEFEQGVDVFVSDYPDCFWMRKNYQYAHTVSAGKEIITAIYPIYCFTGSALTQAREDLNAAVEQIMEGLPDGSDFDKALYLHDTLANRVEYLLVGEHQTAYGALVSGKAVCAGYAAAYQLLLREAGIQAWTVTGTSQDPTQNIAVPHAWNLLWIDGECFYTDVTWNDQGDTLYHYYFNLSREEIELDHITDSVKFTLPACQHDEGSYFDVNGLTVDENTTVSQLAALFGPNIDNTRTAVIYYEGNVDFDNWIEGIVQDLYHELGGGGFSFRYGSSGMGKEVHILLVGTFPPMTYSVEISSGANMSTFGALVQYVEIGNGMVSVVFEAAEGYYFPSTYSVNSKNGISVTRNSSKRITVSGIPTGDTEISLPAPIVMTKNPTPNVVVTATGSDTAILSGVSQGMKYSIGGSVWKDILSSDDIVLTELGTCKIYIIAKGNGEDTLDSDTQVLTLTKAETPKVSITEPSELGGKGSIATDTSHEYSLDGESWTACTGALSELEVGTYYIRVKASGSVLASEVQTAIIHAYDFVKATGIAVDKSLTVLEGESGALKVVITPQDAGDKRVVFSSDNESVATVDANGIIRGISKGSATITVTLVDGGLTATCTVTVECKHSFITEWKYDDDRHWHECSKCEGEGEKQEHSFGEWKITAMPDLDTPGTRERTCECGMIEKQSFLLADNGQNESQQEPDRTETKAPQKESLPLPYIDIGGIGCMSSISAGYAVAIPFICALLGGCFKRRREE